MQIEMRRLIGRVFTLVAFASLCGCAAQLAPAYDRAVTTGLNRAGVHAMTLLAMTSGGTSRETFPAREERYNAVIGELEALAIWSAARPLPKNRVTDAVNSALERRGARALADDESVPPSASALRRIAETFTRMRDVDRKQGVTATEVAAFRGQALIYFDQAITYENFLQR